MKQATIKQATQLGFKVTDRLEQYVSDYDLKLNENTFEETERWSTKKQYFWNVTFPPDYPNQHTRNIYDDAGLLALIKEYNNRHENAKRDAETSQRNIDAMDKFKQRFLRQ
jgi:hypothetical protein